MARILDVNDTINSLEYNLSKLKFVQENFPKVKLQADIEENFIFSSKLVNSNFSDFKIVSGTYDIKLLVYKMLEFEYNGNTEIVVINSIPKSCKIVDVYFKDSKLIVKIHKPIFKSKNKDIYKQVSNECDLAILEFAKEHPSAKFDETITNSRVEKLLILS